MCPCKTTLIGETRFATRLCELIVRVTSPARAPYTHMSLKLGRGTLRRIDLAQIQSQCTQVMHIPCFNIFGVFLKSCAFALWFEGNTFSNRRCRLRCIGIFYRSCSLRLAFSSRSRSFAMDSNVAAPSMDSNMSASAGVLTREITGDPIGVNKRRDRPRRCKPR